MSDNPATDVKRFAGMFAGLIKACERVGRIEDLEREEKATQARVDALKQTESALHAAYDDQVAEARNAIAAEIEQERRNLVNARDEASRTAERITTQAHKEAKEATDAADRLVEQARAELAAVRSRIDDARSSLGEMQRAVNERKQELTDLQDQIRNENKRHAQAKQQLDELRGALR